ncbi:hypothetical protein CPB83DRAFT_849996 [Crepidotus variabilis]|uniref:Rhodopsin domain-containing protein n=1 Tax=Crepidotus variabilis TaxID=179855 RepID=A0A9P6ELD9_9AGAR|nr:hypothetical protein CPB83DRAFT_849996 [Crepidotus variabilis]
MNDKPVPPLNPKILGGCLVFPEFLALGITVLRLHHRSKKRRLWWDDYLALLALLVGLPFFWTSWALVLGADTGSQSYQVSMAWITTVASLCILWLTKISLVLSMARIVSIFPRNLIHRGFLFLAFLLSILGISSSVTRWIVCSLDRSWQHHEPYICPATKEGSVFANTAAVTCDIALVLSTLCLFGKTQISRVAKRLIMAGFCASCLMIAIDTGTMIYGFMAMDGRVRLYLRTLLLHLAAIVNFFACNAIAIITCVYRRINREDTQFLIELAELSKIPSSQIMVLPQSLWSSRRSWALSEIDRGSIALTEVSLHHSDFTSGADSAESSSAGAKSASGLPE